MMPRTLSIPCFLAGLAVAVAAGVWAGREQPVSLPVVAGGVTAGPGEATADPAGVRAGGVKVDVRWEALLRRLDGGVGFPELLAEVAKRGSAVEQRVLRGALIAEWAVRAPAAGLGYFVEKEDARSAGDLLEEWERLDPAAAVAGLRGVREDRRGAVAAEALQHWAGRAPASRIAPLFSLVTEKGNALTVLMNWAKQDPESAAESLLASDWKDDRLAMGLVTAAWAAKHPEAALAWAKANAPAFDEGRFVLWQAIIPLAGQDPQAALAACAELNLPMQASIGCDGPRMAEQMLRQLASRDWQAARTFAEGHLEGEERKKLLTQLALERLGAGEAGPLEAQMADGGLDQPFDSGEPGTLVAVRRYLEGLPEGALTAGQKSLREGFVGKWAESAPAAAMAWVAALPEGQEKERLQGCLMPGLSAQGTDAGPAAAYLASLPEGSRAAAAHGLLDSIVTGPETDWAFLAQVAVTHLPGEQEKLYEVLEGWAQHGAREEAVAAAVTLGGPEQRELNTTRMLGSWGTQDPAGLARWVAAQPEGEIKQSAAAALVAGLADSDAEASVKWAGTISDPALRQFALLRAVLAQEKEGVGPGMRWLEQAGFAPADVAAVRAMRAGGKGGGGE